MEIRGIKYISPTFDNSGYAKASRGNILALYKAGIPLTLAPVSFEAARPDLGEDGKILEALVNKNIDYNVVFIHLTPEFWDKKIERGKTNIGYTIWETSKLHPDWPKFINNSVEKVLVGCEFNVGVFKESGVEKPIGVVPHGINMSEFDGIEPYNINGVDGYQYVFYSIFQWTERKNPLDLLKAYWSAFGPDDNVALVLKTYRSSYADNEKEAIRTTIKRLKMVFPMDYYPPVYFISDMLSESEITGLHARGNCYITLDRGEGFGLSTFAAGAAGNPVIYTGWGGANEYANQENSYPVNYTLEPVFGMPWSPWYRGDQLWAKPDVLDAIAKMREVYRNQREAQEKGLRLKNDIANGFTWDHIGAKIIQEIEAI